MVRIGGNMGLLRQYLEDVRTRVEDRLTALVPKDSAHTGRLYERMLDYPMRDAKGLRPALTVAACGALGGTPDRALGSAVSLEMFHNAFLLHDDVEDDSELRRHRPTMHRELGIPIAMNTGDGMLALALQPLLDNVEDVGLGPALAVLRIVVRMARETAEGQAMELEWIRDNVWDLQDADYLRMVHKKTSWYSFIAPITAGARLSGDPHPARVAKLGRFALLVGAAFQIQDDLLNITTTADAMGKEHAGDLWEGKRTLMLLHALRHSDPAERAWAESVLARPRPSPSVPEGTPTKTAADVDRLLALMDRSGSIEYARQVAVRRIARAGHILDQCRPWLAPGVHTAFLDEIVTYVLERAR